MTAAFRAAIVDRVPKLTNFSIFARMRSAETCCRADEIRLSTTMDSGEAASEA
jgi:hypothetical protein